MTRIMLDPSFDWASSEIWAQACAVVGQSADCQLVPSVNEPNMISGFARFGDLGLGAHVQDSAPRRFSRLPEVLSHPDFGRFERTSTVLFRRENNYGELREIDAEVFLHALLDHSCRLLETNNPDLVLFPVTPHFVETYALWFCAKALGVRVLWFQPSSLAPMMLPRESFSTILAVRDYVDKVSTDSLAVARKSAQEGLARFRQLGVQPYIQRQNVAAQRAQGLRGRWRAVKAVFTWIRTGRFSSKFVSRGATTINPGLERILQVLVPKTLSERLRSRASAFSSTLRVDRPFALFALHYEPERTSVPEGGSESSQLQYLVKAQSVLPEGVALRVREHASQLSPALQGHKGRSQHFYEFVVSRLGMEVDLNTPMQELLGASSVVFTVTGNIALEAALSGVPVVYFGNPWWEGMPGTYAFKTVSKRDFSQNRLVGANSEAVEEFLLHRVLSQMIPGGASESESEMVARFGQLSPGFSRSAGQDLGNFLLGYCESLRFQNKPTKRA